MTPREVVDKIARGDVFLRPVTFREGLTIRQMASIFEEQGLRPGVGVRRRGRERRADPRPRSGRARSRGLPVSRHLRAAAPHDRRRSSSRAWSRGFEKALTPELRAQAAARGLSVRELVTLASIVEKETGKAGRAAARRGGLLRTG